MNNPTKRNDQQLSPAKSPKKSSITGYVLVVSPLLNFYFYIEFQDGPYSRTNIPIFNNRIHGNCSMFESSEDPVYLEVIHTANGKYKVGSSHQIRACSKESIEFPINHSLKETVKVENVSKVVTIRELKQVNAKMNHSRFTLRGRISIGEDKPITVDSDYGTRIMKNDIEIQDATSKVELH